MSNTPSKLRPTCAQILKEKKWQISKREIQQYELVKENFFENIQDKFFENYFESRIELLKKTVEPNSFSLVNIDTPIQIRAVLENFLSE